MVIIDQKQYELFKTVFGQYYQLLCNYAFSFTKDRDEAEDIVQEVFLRIWEKKRGLMESETIRFYLFTAVRNNCLTLLDRKKKTTLLPAEEMASDVVHPLEDQLRRPAGDEISMIKKGLSLLPPKCKDAFLLSRIGNLSYKEIAESMSISVKTVENQIGKAIKILRDFAKEQKVFSIWLVCSFIYFLYR
ncbi:MAG: RNA polymerase sigma-70 factor [Bacteroidetes bacterium]|nr:RNA polymerase sigma-70 factor [Bacteroidota bacterium]